MRVLPLVDCAIDREVMRCRNAAVDRGVASAPTGYTMRWFRFDNLNGTTQAVGEPEVVATPQVPVPAALQAADYAALEVRGAHPDHPGWSTALQLAFRRDAAGAWTTVGVTRQ